MNFFMVACGGFFGSITRYFISVRAKNKLLGTLIANVTGSLLLGFIFRLHHMALISDYMWLFIGLGFCGAYTTFSTFSKETFHLLLEKRFRILFIYVLSSFGLSLVLVSMMILF